MKAYKLVIFDWDGTLMDSIGRIVSSMQNAAEIIDFPIPSQRDVESIIGLSLPKAIPILFPQVTPEQVDKILSSYKTEYLYDNKVATPLFDGVSDLLSDLDKEGVITAVATGKGRVGLDRVMAETNTTHYFKATRCGDEYQSKPHPEMLESLLSYFNLSASDALMIGDTNFDLEMAQRAGIDSVGVTFGVHSKDILEQYNPVAIVDSIPELHKLLLSK